MRQRIDRYLEPFGLDTRLHGHVADVLIGLPSSIRSDLLDDPAFQFSDYETGRGIVALIRVAAPSARGPGRSVVLKRTLGHRPADFIRYVIAHELAHAYLRNGGRWPGDDPELAADALAAEWGFGRP